MVVASLSAGARFGGYEIEELIGTGGMSAVYRARQPALDRTVAVKVIAESLAGDPAFVERFRREALATASLEHPHIVPVYDSGEDSGQLFIVMRLVAGLDLARLLERDQTLAPDIAVGLIEQVAQALDAAHRVGIVHRDVKPANVLLSGGAGARHAYLSDFGIAWRPEQATRLTRSGAIVGTPRYMAPEVVRDGAFGVAADVYALACVLFEALVGVSPFAADDPLAAMAAHLMDPPFTLAGCGMDTPAALDGAIQRALSKQPGDRFATASEFAQAARAALDARRNGGAATLTGDRLSIAEDSAFVHSFATPLVGREVEIAELRAMLAEEHTRVLTLAGPGGMGKTRLALEVARRTDSEFASSVVVVALASVRDAQLVLPTIAEALGIAPRRDADVESTIVDAMLDRTMLLVLDNFEHVRPAASALSRVLARTPRLKLLVTSRAPLRIATERVYEVPPLTLPNGNGDDDLRASLERSDAARLFLARAREVKPGLDLSGPVCDAVADICRILDGMPLALELAAARASHLSITELSRRLDRRLVLLTHGRSDMPERHQSVRAAIDASHDLLAPEQQAVLAQLGVFVGGFTLDAAEHVCGPETDVLDGLSALIDNSLLKHEYHHNRDRYLMLEVIREYALERLDSRPDSALIHDRHANYYVSLADDFAPSLRPGDSDPAVTSRITEELDNFRATLRHLEERRDGERLLRMAVGIGEYWLPRFDRDEPVPTGSSADWRSRPTPIRCCAPPLCRSAGALEPEWRQPTTTREPISWRRSRCAKNMATHSSNFTCSAASGWCTTCPASSTPVSAERSRHWTWPSN